MLNFKNLSPPADFSSKLIEIDSQLRIINGNILYITHEIDKIKKLVTKTDVDSELQKQVDRFFEDDETSPQTESDEQNDITKVSP